MSIIYFRLKFTLKKIIPHSKMSPDFSYFKGIHYTFSPDSESRTRETKLGHFCSGLTNLRAKGKTNPAPNFPHSWISFIVNLAWVILKGELIEQKPQKYFLQVWVQFPPFQRRTLVSQLAPTLLGLSAPWILRSLQLFPGTVSPEIPKKSAEKSGGIRVVSRQSLRDFTGYRYPDIFPRDDITRWFPPPSVWYQIILYVICYIRVFVLKDRLRAGLSFFVVRRAKRAWLKARDGRGTLSRACTPLAKSKENGEVSFTGHIPKVTIADHCFMKKTSDCSQST